MYWCLCSTDSDSSVSSIDSIRLREQWIPLNWKEGLQEKNKSFSDSNPSVKSKSNPWEFHENSFAKHYMRLIYTFLSLKSMRWHLPPISATILFQVPASTDLKHMDSALFFPGDIILIHFYMNNRNQTVHKNTHTHKPDHNLNDINAYIKVQTWNINHVNNGTRTQRKIISQIFFKKLFYKM